MTLNIRRTVVVALALASLAAAADPSGVAPRQTHLYRSLDGWELELSIAVAMTDDPYAVVREQAVGVLASNPRYDRLRLLSLYARDSDARVRARTMVAAGRLGTAGLPIARSGLNDKVPLVRQAAVWAACHGGPDAFEAVERRLRSESDRSVLETAIANLWRFEDAAWQPLAASYAGSKDVYLRRAAAYSLSRAETSGTGGALSSLASDEEPVIRATAIAGMARGALDDERLKIVLARLEDPDWRVRAAACRVLAEHESLQLPEAAAVRVAAEFDSPHVHLAVSAIEAAAVHPGIGTDDALTRLTTDRDGWVAAAALGALAERTGKQVAALADTWFASDDLWRQRAAARVAVRVGSEATAAAAKDPSVRLAWLESLDAEETAARAKRLRALLDSDSDPAVRAQVLMLLEAADAAPDLEELLTLANRWRRDRMPEARAQALISALKAADTDPVRGQVLEIALADTDPVVAAMAVNTARELGIQAELPAREPRHGGRWYADLAEWVRTPRWLDVTTTRGAFRIRLDLTAAPLTSREISDLAADGFYDRLEWHRVVPNFVVQGGDPRGDGWGGPGFALPDEPTLVPFDSWRVGIATSGPQTGGCQLFVTLMPADHLTGHYTNFGEVVAGREVLTTLEVGDTIVSIRPVSGVDPPPLDAAE